MTQNMITQDALHGAIEFLDLAHGDANDDVNAIIAQLARVLEQKGCEHFNSAVTDGRLTTLCDVIIDG